MIKQINGRLWFCCPVCGKKLHPLAPGAICSGVFTQCRKCKWEGPMEIKQKKGA